jgi:hypothetical protein
VFKAPQSAHSKLRMASSYRVGCGVMAFLLLHAYMPVRSNRSLVGIVRLAKAADPAYVGLTLFKILKAAISCAVHSIAVLRTPWIILRLRDRRERSRSSEYSDSQQKNFHKRLPVLSVDSIGNAKSRDYFLNTQRSVRSCAIYVI